MLNLDVSCQRSGTPPNKGFASLRHLLLSETIGSELFGFVGFRVWFSSCHNGFLLKNVILIKQKLLRKSYWFWQSCLEGSWGGISWKCWSLQLWHSLNGTVLIYFFFSFQNDVSKCTVSWGGKKVLSLDKSEWNAWKKRKSNVLTDPRQFFSIEFCNFSGFSDEVGWFKNCWLLGSAICTLRWVSRLSQRCMNYASFCSDKLPGFIAEENCFNPLTIENKIPQVSWFTEPCKDLPLYELFRRSGGNEVPITFTNIPQRVQGWAGIDQTAFIVKPRWVLL